MDAQNEQEAPIYGDILDAILSHVPLIHLLPASLVSNSWKQAVSSSLSTFNKPKPWLLLHTQSTHTPYATTARAYDPRAAIWLEITQPPIKYISTLRSSGSDFLYMLSSTRLSFSLDPLHLTWHRADAPLVWRTDPIVAVVGRRVIVAGGGCDFEDDPLPVEIYDIESRAWSSCDSMPAMLRDCAASTWLSVASDDRVMFVTERNSGLTYTFDPDTKNWSGPYDLHPDPNVFLSSIGFAGDRLILVGILGNAEKLKRVKIYEVNCETFNCNEIGEMPPVIVEELRNGNWQASSMNVSCGREFVYIQNSSAPELIISCEIGDGGCRWGSVRNSTANDVNRNDRFVFSCSEIGTGDLKNALRSGNHGVSLKCLPKS